MGQMPLCQCGHAWGDHAMDSHMDYDIDNGKRPCFALTDEGECRCTNYVVSMMDALESRCNGGEGSAKATNAPSNEIIPS